MTACPTPATRMPGLASHYRSNSAGYAGNQAALRRLSRTGTRVQYKLQIGAVNDPLEAEADRVADQVMRTPEPAGKPKIADPASPAGAAIQRKCAGCEEEEKKLQKSPANASTQDGHAAPPSVDRVLAQPGRPLDADSRSFFEPRMGIDLGGVRLHDDAEAAESSREVEARAFTVGSHIAFANGVDTASQSDRRLLAHELAHVAQQTSLRRTGSDVEGGPRQAGSLLREAEAKGRNMAPAFSHGDNFRERLIQRAPPVPPAPEPSPLILGSTDPAAETESLFHYGDLTGKESFRSTQGYPRLTDCHIAETVEDAAKYTGTPVRDSVKFKYELKIERNYFLKNFKNVATRDGGFSEYGTEQPIPVKYFRKVGTLLRGPSGGAPPVQGLGPGGAAGSGAAGAGQSGVPGMKPPELNPGASPPEVPVPSQVPGGVARGAVEGGEAAVAGAVAKAVIRGGLRFIGGVAIGVAINLIVGKAYSYLTQKLIEGDITEVLQNIPADKQARIEARIDALPSGKKRLARITLDYIMFRSTLGPLGPPDAYQMKSVTLVGVHPGNEELDFPASTDETLGDTMPVLLTQKVRVRISYTVPID